MIERLENSYQNRTRTMAKCPKCGCHDLKATGGNISTQEIEILMEQDGGEWCQVECTVVDEDHDEVETWILSCPDCDHD